MNFQIFIRDLSERVLHIAKNEAERKSYTLKKVTEVNKMSILNLSCTSPAYIKSLVETLETGYKTNVISVIDGEGKHIDFHEIDEDLHVPFYNRDTLSMQREEYAATY